MARPARPVGERVAVLAAARIVRAETGLTAADPIARTIAARVVVEMQGYLAEDKDPFLAALGEARRRVMRSAFATLAIDSTIDAIGLFVEERVERMRARSGRGLSEYDDEAECREVWNSVCARLWRRYLRQLR